MRRLSNNHYCKSYNTKCEVDTPWFCLTDALLDIIKSMIILVQQIDAKQKGKIT